MKSDLLSRTDLFQMDALIEDREDCFIHRDGSLVYFDTCDSIDHKAINSILCNMPYGSTLQFYHYNSPGNPNAGYALAFRIPIDYSYMKISWITGFKYILAGFQKIRKSIRSSTLQELDKICQSIPRYHGSKSTSDAIISFLSPSESTIRIEEDQIKADEETLSVISVKNPDCDRWIDEELQTRYEYVQCFTILRPRKKEANKLTDDLYEHRNLVNSVVGDRVTSEIRVDTILPSMASHKFIVYKDAMTVCINVTYAVKKNLKQFTDDLFDRGLLTYKHQNTLRNQYQSLFPGNCYFGRMFQYSYYSGILKLLRNYE